MGWIEEQLSDLRQHGLRRELRTVSSPPGPEMLLGGRPVLQFASNDYLGLAADSRLADAVCAAARTAGAGAAASRLLVGSHETVARLEGRLAELKGAAAALVFPTGYMANLAIISTLAGPGDAVFADRLCHASILDGVALSRARLVTYGHNDPAALAGKLAAKGDFRRRLVVTESVFSMDGDVAPLAELAAVARRHEAMFVVDEAHATGVFGPSGAGVAEAQGLAAADLTATVGTLSKALGGLGGFVTASQSVIDLLVNCARPFIFTTGVPPAQAAAALAALDVVRDEPERRVRLLATAAVLRRRLAASGADTGQSSSQIIPVMLGEAGRATAVAAGLLERGLLVPAIRQPTVKAGQCRLRISLSSAHTDEQIERLATALAEVLAE
jgi:8-amino-7-oxononanoate synthase